MTDILNRRKFIALGAQLIGITAGSAVLNPAASMVLPERKPSVTNVKDGVAGARQLSFRNAHTGDVFSGVYRVGDTYLPEAFEKINFVLRDHRSNEIFPIDPRVLDIMYQVRKKTGTSTPYEVLSGYRCPKTNAMLRARSGGVAKRSLHMTGQAVDMRIPGYSTRRLRDLAISLKAGGVGYYSRSNFVHMDTGQVRSW